MLLHGDKAGLAGAGQDARPRNRPDREVLYARQPIPRQAEDSTESPIGDLSLGTRNFYYAP
jgi:hypothetical protein